MGRCIECEKGYSFDGISYNKLENYADFKAGYYYLESAVDSLELFTKCVKNDHCARTLEGFCVECEDDYVLVRDGVNYLGVDGVPKTICVKDDKCIKKGVIIDDEKIDFCVECEEGYHIDPYYEYKCTKDDHCVKVNSESNTCEECEKDYTVSEKTGMCEYNKYCNGLDNEQHVQVDRCISCMNGYHLNKERICEDAHCVRGWLADGCEECEEGYTWNPEKKLCKKNKHCKTIDGEGQCMACDEGYTVRGSIEVTEEGNTEIKGRLICMHNPHCNGTNLYGICDSCEYGYRLFTEVDSHGSYRICEAVDHDHCIKTLEEEESSCVKCEEGYSIAYVNTDHDGSGYSYHTAYDDVVGVTHDVRKKGICVKNKDCVGVGRFGECLVCDKEVELNTRTGICGSISTFILLAVLLVFLL